MNGTMTTRVNASNTTVRREILIFRKIFEGLIILLLAVGEDVTGFSWAGGREKAD
jgi:hypothetical protein